MFSPDWNSLDAVSKFVSLLGVCEWSFLAVAAVTEVTTLFVGKTKRLQWALEITAAVAFLAFIPILHFEHVYSDRAAQLLTATIQSQKELLSQTSAEFEAEQRNLGVAEDKILKLELQHQPRTLTKGQRDQIILELRPYSGRAGVAIRVLSLDTEAQSFANQLASVLQDSGWAVAVDTAILRKGQPFFGLKVDVGDVRNPPPGASALVTALRHAGISVNTGLDTDDGPKGLYLLVGGKP